MKELHATYSERDKVLQLYLGDDLIHIETLPTTDNHWFTEKIDGVEYDFNFDEHYEKGAYSLIKYEKFIDLDGELIIDSHEFAKIELKVE